MHPLHSLAQITSALVEDALGYSPADDAFALHKTGDETKTGDLAIAGTLTSDEIVAGVGGVVIAAGSVLTLTGTAATSVIQTTPYGDAIRFPASVFGWDGNVAQFFTAPLLRGNLEFVLGNAGCYGWGSSVDPLGVADTKLKRVSSGVVGIYRSDGAFGNLAARDVDLIGFLKVGPITFATLPSASANPGAVYRITDRGQKHCYSDGTNWKFINGDTTVT